MGKGRIILLALLLAAAAGSYFLFRPADGLKELKSAVEVTENREEMYQLTRSIAAAAQGRDAVKKLRPFMAVNDAAETERITEPLTAQPPLGELRFLGCSTPAAKNSGGNLCVHAYSAGRKQCYAFSFRKDAKGKYKLAEIGLSPRKP